MCKPLERLTNRSPRVISTSVCFYWFCDCPFSWEARFLSYPVTGFSFYVSCRFKQIGRETNNNIQMTFGTCFLQFQLDRWPLKRCLVMGVQERIQQLLSHQWVFEVIRVFHPEYFIFSGFKPFVCEWQLVFQQNWALFVVHSLALLR